jgi:ELWxxDGT repeat protein
MSWLWAAALSIPISSSHAADTEIKKLLHDAINKAVFSSQDTALNEKDVSEVNLLLELDETKKLLAEDPTVFEFLGQQATPPLQPQRLSGALLATARNLDGRKSLMLAFLIKNGAAGALQPKGGQFPGAAVLALAAKAAGSQSVKVLLEAGCDSQLKSPVGSQVLAAAAFNAWLYPDTLPLLLKAGAPVIGEGNRNTDPLLSLIGNYCESPAQFAPPSGASSPMPLSQEEQNAIMANCEGTLAALVKAGADVTAAMEEAINKGYPKAVTTMLQSPGCPENETMLKWLIAGKLKNRSYDEAAFNSIKDALAKHKTAVTTGAVASALPAVRAFFHGFSKEHGDELWTTDGTAEGTRMVADLEPGPRGAQIKCFAPVEGAMCFLAHTEEKQWAIYRVDAEARQVDSMLLENLHEAAAVDNQLVLVQRNEPKNGTYLKERYKLWQSDGTPNGTLPVAHERIQVLDYEIRDRRFFFTMPAANKRDQILAELKPAQRQIIQHVLIPQRDSGAENSFHLGAGQFLWHVNKVLRHAKEGSGSALNEFFSGIEANFQTAPTVGGQMFFPGRFYTKNATGSAWVDKFGMELFCTDGTVEGTRLVKDIVATPGDKAGSSPKHLTAFHGKLLFVANDGVHGEEPWISDGSEQGTQLLLDIVPGSKRSDSAGFTPFGRQMLFAVPYGESRGLWSTDGTSAGTTKVRSFDNSIYPESFVNAGGCVLFYGESQAGRGLWRTDGTPAGTRFVKEIGLKSKMAVLPVQKKAPSSN